MTGRIVKIIEDRGFGFVRCDDGKDLFFHVSALEGLTWGTSLTNLPVSFEKVDGDRGPEASQVKAAE